jgi:hypothetical protein
MGDDIKAALLNEIGDLPLDALLVPKNQSDKIVEDRVRKLRRFVGPKLPPSIVEKHNEAINLTSETHEACKALLDFVEVFQKAPSPTQEELFARAGLALDRMTARFRKRQS